MLLGLKVNYAQYIMATPELNFLFNLLINLAQIETSSS